MKKETIIKRILKSDLVTKRGTLKRRYERVFDAFVWAPKERHQLKFWHDHGTSLNDYTSDFHDVCRVLGIDYIETNDAPRCGQEGWNIRLTTKGRRQLKEYSDYVKAHYESRWVAIYV